MSVFAAAILAFAQDPASADPKQRIKAVRAFAKEGAQAVPQLTPLTTDQDLDVRREAVNALIDIGTQHTLDPLINSLRDGDTEIQIRATDGIVNVYYTGYYKTGLASHLKRVGGLVFSKFSAKADEVIPSYLAVRPEAIEGLAKLLSTSRDPIVRANAARAIGVLRGKAAVPELVRAIVSKDSAILYEVIMALQKIGDASAAPALGPLLRDPDEKVQLAALETAGLLRNPAVIGQAREAMERARNEKVRRAALECLAQIAEESSRSRFEGNLASEDEYLRASAAEGVGRLGRAADAARMAMLFEDERKMRPRLSQAFAAVRLGKRELSTFSPLQYLVNTLNSKSYRGIAEPLLTELAGNPEIRESLYPLLNSATKDEKRQLVWILARSGDKSTDAHLEVLTHDADSDVASEAIRALRALRARLP